MKSWETFLLALSLMPFLSSSHPSVTTLVLQIILIPHNPSVGSRKLFSKTTVIKETTKFCSTEMSPGQKPVNTRRCKLSSTYEEAPFVVKCPKHTVCNQFSCLSFNRPSGVREAAGGRWSRGVLQIWAAMNKWSPVERWSVVLQSWGTYKRTQTSSAFNSVFIKTGRSVNTCFIVYYLWIRLLFTSLLSALSLHTLIAFR